METGLFKLPLFKVGKWKGDIYTEQDLDTMVSEFKEYPVMLDNEQVGIVSNIKRVGKQLYATLNNLTTKALQVLLNESYGLRHIIWVKDDIKQLRRLELLPVSYSAYSLPGEGGERKQCYWSDYRPESEDNNMELWDSVEQKKREYSAEGKEKTDEEIIEELRRDKPELFWQYTVAGDITVWSSLTTNEQTKISQKICPRCGKSNSIQRAKIGNEFSAKCSVCNFLVNEVPEYVNAPIPGEKRMSLAEKMVQLSIEKGITLAQSIELLKKSDYSLFDDYKSPSEREE